MIYVGIGGWTFEPWRGTFYPKGLAQARELDYASQHLTAIEINGTFYGSQKPASFRKWHAETPDGFVFSVKGPRFAVNRRELKQSGESIERFFDSGVTELKEKLGPLLWQFAPTKKYDEEDFGAFLDLLPKEADGRKLRHVVEVRHDSFGTPAFTKLASRAKVAICYADSDKYPEFEEDTADFFYARLMKAREEEALGYSKKQLDQWLARARDWEKTGEKKRDVFVFFINGAKVRAPLAAQALIERLSK
jgi:uncharacterized protein YecE (DUF72 family)